MTSSLDPRTRKAILQIADWQIGVMESPSGSNKQKYGKAYNLNGYPWCMMFVWWIFREAGFNLFKSASCTKFVNQYKNKSPEQVVRNEFKPGDIVFFDFTGKKSKTEHCGIVESVNANGTVTTIEGNTAIGNNSNGGEVMRRERNLKYITCAVRPRYGDVK